MAVGAISCPRLLVPYVNRDIRQIKEKYRLFYPIRWSRLNPCLDLFYQELLDYFFSNNFLKFQGLVIEDKHKLYPNRRVFRFELGYYTIYSELCLLLMSERPTYNLYLSTTDARSRLGSRNIRSKLNEYYNPVHIKNIQTIRFVESELLQLTNLFVGTLTYTHRQLSGNTIKLRFIDKLNKRKNSTQFNEVIRKI